MRLVDGNDYPAMFQMCRDLDSGTYYKFLADAFIPRVQTAIYRSFANRLKEIKPLFIVTTNVDEGLEKNLPMCQTVQRADISRCVDLLQNEIPFVVKLHGSVSSMGSTIFTTSDYNVLVNHQPYIQSLKYIFTACSVVFIAYGVRDAYVLQLLNENALEMDLFGPGPHFLVSNDPTPVKSLHRIGYQIKLRPDHSASLSALDSVIQAVRLKEEAAAVVVSQADENEPDDVLLDAAPVGKTAYYIADLMPPGTWSTSAEITAEGAAGTNRKIEASFGLGFTNDEIPFAVSTAMHDIVVALICFDYIYLPLFAVGPLLGLVGEGILRELLGSSTLRLIHSETRLGVLFESGEPIGSLGNVMLNAKDGSLLPEPMSDTVRKLIKPVKGKENEAEVIIGEVERRTLVYKRGNEVNMPSLVRGALMMPAISRLLGIGDAITPSQVPRWLRYPYLRLAHLVETAALCSEYRIPAAKVPFGGRATVRGCIRCSAIGVACRRACELCYVRPFQF